MEIGSEKKMNTGTIATDIVVKLKDSLTEIDGSTNIKEKKVFSKKIIGVYGITHSAGVSSFITELAFWFAKNKYNVAILDGHLLTPYQRIYNSKEVGSSFTDKITKDTGMEDIVIKSQINPNIDYFSQNPIDLGTLLGLDECDDLANMDKTISLIKRIRQSYDVVLIDIDVDLVMSSIEHGFIKACEEFVQLNIESIKNVLNAPIISRMIQSTARQDAKTIVLNNKVTTPRDICLPYEEHFKDTYNNAKSFLAEGMSSTPEYEKRFETFMEFLLKDLYEVE